MLKVDDKFHVLDDSKEKRIWVRKFNKIYWFWNKNEQKSYFLLVIAKL